MKILHINISESEGGASRAAYRLHRSLLGEGVESQMLVRTKAGDDFTVIGPTTQYNKAQARVVTALDLWPVKKYKAKNGPFSPAWLSFGWMLERIREIAPDLVHYHWMYRGGIGVKSMPKVIQPAVWSLHDMWPFTGGCHYDDSCGKYKSACEKCPVLGSEAPKDLSNRVYNAKRRAFAKVEDLTIVGLSRWMADAAAESELFKERRIVNLPNPIDTGIYKPLDKKVCRDILGLQTGRKYVLFGAVSPTSDRRKGYTELLSALKRLEQKGDTIELLIFGASAPRVREELGFSVHYMGMLNDDISLQVLYCAADVMVVPSLQENLSNAIMEAISCGTPVVGFDIGGNKDLIDHMENGYLARELDISDLANGIVWTVAHSDVLSSAARRKACAEFDYPVVAKRYIKLYEEILAAK